MTDRIERVSELLARRRLRLVTAESCTGGIVAARFTDRPGASRFFDSGLITYSDSSKQDLLGVLPATLAAHGAVSEAVAREMVEGALKRADVALAITGIAGPGGGTPEKPVGTVWVAAGVGERRGVRHLHVEGDRARVRGASADAAVELLQALLEEG